MLHLSGRAVCAPCIALRLILGPFAQCENSVKIFLFQLVVVLQSLKDFFNRLRFPWPAQLREGWFAFKGGRKYSGKGDI